jgi:hypothetical protein
MSGANKPIAPVWRDSARVRMDTLRRGDRFIAIDGDGYTYDRVDGASSGVHHVTCDDGARTSFAGCAEVVRRHVEPQRGLFGTVSS